MKFGIVCNFENKVARDTTKNIIQLLEKRKHSVEVEEKSSRFFKRKGVPIRNMKVDVIISVGDDATILRTFRELGDNEIPVLGVSCGATGFLSEVDVKNFESSLKLIEDGDFFIEKRTRLSARINDRKLPYALNEVVICSSKGATLIRYSLKINGELIFRDLADGVIISTPTGSTGYALSAGGPVIAGSSKVFIIVPNCSMNQNKPYVVSDDSEIEITNISSSSACRAIVDGRVRVNINGKKVMIEKAKTPAYFLRLKGSLHSRIFGKLRERMEREVIPKDAPPSAKFIYRILQYEGPLTQKELISTSMLPARTVRHALNYLMKKGLVKRQTSLRDTRQSIYALV